MGLMRSEVDVVERKRISDCLEDRRKTGTDRSLDIILRLFIKEGCYRVVAMNLGIFEVGQGLSCRNKPEKGSHKGHYNRCELKQILHILLLLYA
jgi:hypothetical protein